ncbi:tRNA (adenosine(37)-N6)-threonylcarbamoyltransferase complex dimerization subunit type 1 TsaB [Lentisphaera profundi]|uniref:tRNA (Adenosine(37)-N6)-threonylcarbamoyltransferase complex dimerization subunit type 1 TsaB n=1 Tax=Lentisphaera profundi TaxID=1658616 RepID=A0ABY7VZI4_9BACT|nr:tRNA (adenosine(37)-N6)-threonylcarbamoyltransferase complex dimerization subunit type 1 TsaB [Lentisphaera profundi]WDE98124.1 tRNA (adenosine(37)-N6)-threonylcarbamoyltransferase complex dimerization subunit type 1 TsaB [Lentisphaera profundi]
MIALLDTATDTAVFALMKNGETLFHAEKTGRFGASVILPKMIESASAQGLNMADVTSWLVGKGPGSFTGTRVGIAFAHGLSTGFGTLMKGSNSGYTFLDHALKQNSEAKSIAVLHDGRRDEVIVNIFQLKNQQWIAVEIFICKIIEIAEKTASIDALVSPMPFEKLSEVNHSSQIICDVKPHIQGLCRDQSIEPSNASDEALGLHPIYVRPAVFVEPLKTRNPQI